MNALNHALPQKNRALLNPVLIRQLLVVWGLFFLLSTLYCYGYALYVNGDYAITLLSALECATRDWLIWALISPLLVYRAADLHLSSFRAPLALVSLWLGCIVITASFRVMLEAVWGSASPLQVAWIYFPRYLFFASFVLLAGFAYWYRQYRLQSLALAELHLADDPVEAIPTAPKTLQVTKGQAKMLLPVTDIICVCAAGNYLEIHTRDNSYLMRATMKTIEHELDAHEFVRIHRSYLVRGSAIVSVTRKSMSLKLVNGMQLRWGQSYAKNLTSFPLRAAS